MFLAGSEGLMFLAGVENKNMHNLKRRDIAWKQKRIVIYFTMSTVCYFFI